MTGFPILSTMIVLPEGVHDYAEGDVVDVIPY